MANIFALFELEEVDMALPVQNLEGVGLTRKIFWNKQLMAGYRALPKRTGAHFLGLINTTTILAGPEQLALANAKVYFLSGEDVRVEGMLFA